MEIQLVPQYKFLEMGKKSSLQSISEKGKIKDTVFFNNQEFVINGSMGSGNGKGTTEIYGNKVVDLDNYRGDLKPVKRDEHWKLINEGKRQRGYEGQLLPCGSRWLVLCESHTFRAVAVEVQQEIF